MKTNWLSSFFKLFKKKQPDIPDRLWRHTLSTLSVFKHLNGAEQTQLKALCREFLAEKEFSGAQGLQLNDRILVNIAAQACLPILKLGSSAYRGWVGIIVYPNEFVISRQVMDENGVMHEFEDTVAGEAWEGGPVILSWQDARQSDESYNVVIHEFAHKLDMLNGAMDGMPALHSGLTGEIWKAGLYQAYNDFCQRLEAGEAVSLDPYAAEDPSEFFAVASECFFANPVGFQTAYPDFYQLLSRYYRQNPAQNPDLFE